MAERRILMGVIGRPHGVRGHVRVTSYAAAPDGLAAYGPLVAEDGRPVALRLVAPGIAEIEGVRDRDAAARLTNLRLYLDRAALPPPGSDDYYHADLIGLAAETADGAPLGRVVAVHDYGAGASLEIGRDGAPPLLVPFTRAAVPVVDPQAGRVVVEPPAELAVRPEEQAA